MSGMASNLQKLVGQFKLRGQSGGKSTAAVQSTSYTASKPAAQPSAAKPAAPTIKLPPPPAATHTAKPAAATAKPAATAAKPAGSILHHKPAAAAPAVPPPSEPVTDDQWGGGKSAEAHDVHIELDDKNFGKY
jgi:hypothetical protein